MPTTQIKDITSEQTVINNTDYTVLQETGGTTKKTTFGYIKTWILTWIYSYIYPVGCFYTQYPDAASNTDATAFPTATRPATLFGGTWVSQFDTENVFFRTGGTDYQTRTNGLSADEIQGHWHNFEIGTVAQNANADMDTTTWITSRSSTGAGTGRNAKNGTPNAVSVTGEITDGVNGTPRIGAVTEPRNRLFKIWKRTA
jgi:hypothetical protein